MIVFVVTIQEEEQGRVRLVCDTPPGRATLPEINCGMEFKTKFKEWSQGYMRKDWSNEVKPLKN